MRDDGLTPRGKRDYVEQKEVATEWYTSDWGPDPVMVAQYDMLISYKASCYSGFNTPNFRNRISRGELIRPTPWYQFDSKGEILAGVLDYKANYPPNSHDWFSNQHGARIVPDTWVIGEPDMEGYAPYIYDQYVSQAANAIYAQGFDMLTFLAELPEVYRLFESILKGFLKTRGLQDRYTAAGRLYGGSCAYLGYRYGWGPLLRDCKSLAALLESLEERKVKRYVRTARGQTMTRYGSTGGVQGGCFFYRLNTTDDVKVSIHGFVAADVSIPSLQFNPIVTAWEKVPFSFLVDWIVNVGQTLGALSLLAVSEQYVAAKGFSVDLKRTTSLTLEAPNENFAGGTMYRYTEAAGTMTRREPCGIPLLPRFKFNVKDVRKIMDLLALFVTRFNGWR